MARIMLENGTEEVLLSNLPDDVFSANDFAKKEGMIRMATARSGTIRGIIYKSIVKEIQAYTIPVRQDRHFQRNTATRKTKHSINRKSSY